VWLCGEGCLLVKKRERKTEAVVAVKEERKREEMKLDLLLKLNEMQASIASNLLIYRQGK